MSFFCKKEKMANSTRADIPPRMKRHAAEEMSPQGHVPAIAVTLGAVASIGGFMFGYESGQISGFLAMSDFVERFGDNGEFSNVRQGTIVGLLA
jgi:SP family sugar:H+ symporter-like MFS transporter